MPKVFNRLLKQVTQRRQPHAGRVGVHTMVNGLLSYCLQVDAFLRTQVGTENNLDDKLVDALEEGEHLREAAKLWLGGK